MGDGSGGNLASIIPSDKLYHGRSCGKGALFVRRPRQSQIRYPNKPKSLDRTARQDELERAAAAARYVPSEYHCPVKGRPRKRRAKPAMTCPREWTISEARNAIRLAIMARRISARWTGGFPRHVWHREGDVWYEARTQDGAPGEYHAYPIEHAAVPAGL